MTLCGSSKSMKLQEITTINLNQLDHILLNKDMKEEIYVTSYDNFASDHRSIVFRIGNKFTQEFLRGIHFASEDHMKSNVNSKTNIDKDGSTSKNETEESKITNKQKNL